MPGIRWNTDRVHLMEQQLRRAQQALADAHQQAHQVAGSLGRALRVPADIKQGLHQQLKRMDEVEGQLHALCGSLRRCDDMLSQTESRLTARAAAIEERAHPHPAPAAPPVLLRRAETPEQLKWLHRPIIPGWQKQVVRISAQLPTAFPIFPL